MRLGSVLSEALRNIGSGVSRAFAMFLAVLLSGTLLGGYEAMTVIDLESQAVQRINAYADVNAIVGGTVDGTACDRLSDAGDGMTGTLAGAMRAGEQVVPLATPGKDISSYDVTPGMIRLIAGNAKADVSGVWVPRDVAKDFGLAVGRVWTGGVEVDDVRREMQQVVQRHAGVFRTQNVLAEGVKTVVEQAKENEGVKSVLLDPAKRYALGQWNKVKADQKSTRGKAVPFQNEYDATVKNTDYPIHYSYFSHLRPPVPASQELSVAKYCYDAGNVNLYQAQQVAHYFGIKTLPAVVVDGNVLSSVSASSILKAME